MNFGLPSIASVTYNISSRDYAVAETIVLPQVMLSPRGRTEAQPSHGVYTRWHTTFKIDPVVWTQQAGNRRPKLRDSLLYNGQTWTVYKDVDDPADSPLGLWRLCCVALIIEPTLARKITFHPPADETDEFASPITDQAATIPEQDCAIQETGEEDVLFQGVVHGRRFFYSIWVLSEPRLLEGAIAVDDRGYTYTVLAVINRRRLDELVEVLAKIDP